MTINLKVPDMTELKPRITVVGVGGAGGNAVNNMIESGLEGVEFVVANTDAQALAMSQAERRVQMGAHVTEGLGAGSKPEIGAAAAEEAMPELQAQLSGSHMVFITAGMGGGTGTGAAPVIARAAYDQKILTVGVVTKPFQFEGKRRMETAEAGIRELEKVVDTLIVIPNQNLFRVATEKTTFADAFALADEVLYSGVACITDLMVKEGLINLDFADVSAIMRGMGKAMMGTGEASGEERASEAAEAAISNPLLDDVSMKGARGLLISITGGNDLTLYEVDEAASRIREEVDTEANIILGATFDEKLDGVVRVSVVATGLDQSAMPEAVTPEAPAQPVVKTLAASLNERIKGLDEPPTQAPTGRPAQPPMAAPTAQPPAPQEAAAEEPAVWQGPGDVKIEKRAPGIAGKSKKAAKKAAAQADAQQNFVPQPPSLVKRGARQMPAIEQLPAVAQKELKAKAEGAAEVGLAAQKKKIGFFERLAGIGRAEMPQDVEISREQEPPMEQASKPETAVEEIKATGTDGPIAPSQPSAAPQPAPAQPAGQEAEDLEIPAFLRRQ